MNHAHSPASFFEYFIVAVAAVSLILSFALALRYTFRPGETSPDHIKNRMLNED